jgi:tRNA (mo5U34)-methyltransferase
MKPNLIKTEDLKNEIAKIKWYHSIDFGNAITTPGIDNTPERLKEIQMPEDLKGYSVLDIGAWDGFFSFEAERRGADRVLAVDSFCWSGEGWGTKSGFELARRVFQSKVEDKEIDVLSLSPENVGTFDLVLFLGVFYHMRHPILALEKVAGICKKQLILDTQVDMLGVKDPVMAFYPDSELNNDPTNWFGPNPPALIGALKSVGFQKVTIVYPPAVRISFPWRFARAVKNSFRGEPFLKGIRRGRMIVHAWK